MSLLSFLKRRPPAPVQHAKPKVRRATIEWRGAADQRINQEALLQSDKERGLFALVKQRPPSSSIAQIREDGSSYPVKILSTSELDHGFELQLEYFEEGRRRERRTRARGGAVLGIEGSAPIDVEVLNVSAGGMQLFAAQPATVGSAARLSGAETNHTCFVRYCRPESSGYKIGIQFYGEDHKKGGPSGVDSQ